MERAKWHWAKGEQAQAVAVLKRGIQKFFPSSEIIKQAVLDDSTVKVIILRVHLFVGRRRAPVSQRVHVRDHSRMSGLRLKRGFSSRRQSGVLFTRSGEEKS